MISFMNKSRKLTGVLSSVLLLSLFVPILTHAFFVSPGCDHYTLDSSTGAGGYSGAGCTTEALLALATNKDLSQVERVDAIKAAIDSLRLELAIKKACFVPTRDLSIGSTDTVTNGEVKKLQLWLKANGFFHDAQGTGYYGEKTASAVLAWQHAQGLKTATLKTGVDKTTREKIIESCK